MIEKEKERLQKSYEKKIQLLEKEKEIGMMNQTKLRARVVKLNADLGREKKNFTSYKQEYKINIMKLNDQAKATASLQKTVELLVKKSLVEKKDMEWLQTENSKMKKDSAAMHGVDSVTTRCNLSLYVNAVGKDVRDEVDGAIDMVESLNKTLRGSFMGTKMDKGVQKMGRLSRVDCLLAEVMKNSYMQKK